MKPACLVAALMAVMSLPACSYISGVDIKFKAGSQTQSGRN